MIGKMINNFLRVFSVTFKISMWVSSYRICFTKCPFLEWLDALYEQGLFCFQWLPLESMCILQPAEMNFLNVW